MSKEAGDDVAKGQEGRQLKTVKNDLSSADETDIVDASTTSLLPGEEPTALTKDEMDSVCAKLNEFARSHPDRVDTSADAGRREREERK